MHCVIGKRDYYNKMAYLRICGNSIYKWGVTSRVSFGRIVPIFQEQLEKKT